MKLLRSTVALALAFLIASLLGGTSAVTAAVSISNRPFAVDTEILAPSVDGLFDITEGEYYIGVYLLNDGPGDISNVEAVCSVNPLTGITVIQAVDSCGTLVAGVPTLCLFRADFSGSTPDKHLVSIQVTGTGFSQVVSRHLFVCRSHLFYNLDSTEVHWSNEAPEGTLTATIDSAYGGTDMGSASALTRFTHRVDYNTPFLGQFPSSPLPFGDPWWKVVGAAGIVVGVVGAFVANLFAKKGWSKLLMRISGGVLAAGCILVMYDQIDPFRAGEENTVPLPGALTLSEDVLVSANYLLEPVPGALCSAAVNWQYTRHTDLGDLAYVLNDTFINDRHFTTSRTITVNDTSFSPGESLWVYAQANGYGSLSGDNAYFVAHVGLASDTTYDTLKSFVLWDDGKHGDAVAMDGMYTGRLSTSVLPVNRSLHLYVCGYDLNNAVETDPPLIQAQEIGGMLIAPPAFSGKTIVPDYTLRVESCCTGTTGNVNDGVNETPDLSDLSLLIAYLISTPKPTLPCPAEANINGSVPTNPDLSDLSLLISYLTITPKPVLPNCPTS